MSSFSSISLPKGFGTPTKRNPDMAIKKLRAKVTYVPDEEAVVNFRMLLATLRRIILSDNSLANLGPKEYNVEKKGNAGESSNIRESVNTTAD